jgi:plastocyanin
MQYAKAAARAAALMLALGAAAIAAEPLARSSVGISNFSFRPAQARARLGQVVVWKNLDSEPHTAVSLDGAFRSPALDQGESFTWTPARAGSYRYICGIHPQMTGVVIVTP